MDLVHGRMHEAVAAISAAGCTEAWLVGSFGRGTPDAASDVDIVVKGLMPARRPDLWWTLCSLFDREVDLAEMERIPEDRLAILLAESERILP